MTSTQAGVQQQDVCSELIMAVGGDSLIGDHTKISRLCDSKANVPDEAINGAKNVVFEDVVSRLNGDLLSKFILEDRIPVIVLALEDILSKDSIGISTHIGKYSKSELLSMVDVDAAEFLASFLIYTCAEVKNRNGNDKVQICLKRCRWFYHKCDYRLFEYGRIVMLKGKSVIELTDVHTGKKKCMRIPTLSRMQLMQSLIPIF